MVILDISGVFIKMVQTLEVMLKGVMVTSTMLHSVIIVIETMLLCSNI